MNNKQNVTIAVLVVTATILLAMVVGMFLDSPNAYASASVSKGDYVMLTAQMGTNTDFIYVVNIATHQMIVYAPNRQRGLNNADLTVVDKLDLDKIFTD